MALGTLTLMAGTLRLAGCGGEPGRGLRNLIEGWLIAAAVVMFVCGAWSPRDRSWARTRAGADPAAAGSVAEVDLRPDGVLAPDTAHRPPAHPVRVPPARNP